MFVIPHWLVLAAELIWLERKIAATPYWGAALGAMDERARGLRRNFSLGLKMTPYERS